MSYYIGIDPGAKGYLCLLDPSGPVIKFVKNPTSLKDMHVVRKELRIYAPVVKHVAIEDVHSLYGMSAKSNFKFGYNLGFITALVCCYLPYNSITLVQPKKWQAQVGAPSQKFLGKEMKLKQAIADIAEALYPNAELYGPKGGLQDGKADALMIAHWLYLQDKENEC